MKRFKTLKLLTVLLLAGLGIALPLLPVRALGGTDVGPLSTVGAGGPDLEMSDDGTRLALVYYKQDVSSGSVYIKSATASQGWVGARLLGTGLYPQVAFKPGANNIVYVVWLSSDRKLIKSARCTLNNAAPPTCTAGDSVRDLSSTTSTLGAPDLTVDSQSYLYAAWEKEGNIELSRANGADSVTVWPSSPTTVDSSGTCIEPALAWANNGTKKYVHLAYFCDPNDSTAKQLKYYRITEGNSSGTLMFSKSSLGVSVTTVKNLSLAARSSTVFLTWDGLRSGTNFALLSLSSTDSGTTWGNILGVPSSTAYGGSGENKLSSISQVPIQEYGLRPSLALSSTQAIVVWQQLKGDGTCYQGSDGSSDAHFTYPSTSTISDTLEHVATEYVIDPDVAAIGNGVGHFTFMKEVGASNCIGGEASDYAIYYRRWNGSGFACGSGCVTNAIPTATPDPAIPTATPDPAATSTPECSGDDCPPRQVFLPTILKNK